MVMKVVIRSFRRLKLVIPMKSKSALMELKRNVERRYGKTLRLHQRGRSLVIQGDAISNYKVRNWILKEAMVS